ncbi:hypothetical protein MLD38_037774 [Melastoma candidum]|uniref:Uncharacterized protein n=1 Tax=Melastoma candidum TaxID=119954 RepID=A0ACB9LN29_9MYRT|nr:hypothetical protein MLD38_037774 [Melastoma candidum]
MATDVDNAEASQKRKSKSKKKKVKSTTLPPPLPPSDDHGVDEEELPQQQDGSPVAAASPVSKRKRHLEVDQEDGREDPVDDGGGKVPKSAEPVSGVHAKGGDPVTPTEAAAAAALGMTSAKRPGSKWGDAEQLTLLKEMVGYTEGNGPCKLSKPYVTSFRSSLPEGSSTCRFSVTEILEKMKDLKRMHANPNGMGKGNGKGRKPHVLEMVELAVKLWGEAGRGTVQKERKLIEEVEVRVDDNDDDGSRRGSGRGALLWEEAVVGFARNVFTWPEEYTRSKIASMGRSAKDSLARKWMKAKSEEDMAALNLIRAEAECLAALLSS